MLCVRAITRRGANIGRSSQFIRRKNVLWGRALAQVAEKRSIKVECASQAQNRQQKQELGMLVALVMAGGMVALATPSQCEEQRRALPCMDVRGQYALYKELGRGGFSVVRLACDMETNQWLAAKIFDPRYASLQDIRAEIEMLRYLGKHEHIVSLHDVLFLKEETIMFTDLVQGGELFDYVVDMGSLSEKEASRMLRDVCQGLHYIHSMGVCHRDLKPENVLLSDQTAAADIKIADFGLSRRMRQGEKMLENQPSGTIAYWAPEIIKRQPQDFGVDMWAFGVLVYITLTGVHPFDPKGDRSDAEIMAAIAKGEYDVQNNWYQHLSPGAQEFLMRLLDSNPRTRMTAEQALSHAWLRGEATSTVPLGEDHALRLASYQRLQKLRANVLAVIVGVQHSKIGEAHATSSPASEPSGSHRTTTVNMDMFKEAFALFDKDDSGDIDRTELAGVMVALGHHLTSDEIDGIMAQADTDGDGMISFMEFVNLMNQRLMMRGELNDADLHAAFKIFDSDGNGYICASELAYMMHLLGTYRMSNADIDSIMNAVDRNGDGQIDFDEFCVLMRGLTKTL